MKKIALMRLAICLIFAAISINCANAASLLPPGKNCFFTAAGVPNASGTVTFYIPGSTTPKDTWVDADQTVLNINPVTLDAAGCAVIYGVGTYRQILKDSTGNTIWDQPTAAGHALNESWSGSSGGSANAQTLTNAEYNGIDGDLLYFLATFSNSGPMTIDVNGDGAVAVVRDGGSGPVALVGGEVISGNVVGVVYSSTTGQFHLITPTTIQTFDSALYFSGIITPTILAADQNDWTPSGGFPTSNTVRVSSNADISITGMTGGAAGRVVVLHNVGSFTITFPSSSTLSLAANRFQNYGALILKPNDSMIVQYDATSTALGWRALAPIAEFPPSYISGCTMSNNALDATNDLDIAVCNAGASNTVGDIRIATALVKQLDATWVAGTNQGMRSSAALANATWHIFAIGGRAVSGDIFAHTAADPTSVLPTGYTYYKRIGSIIRSGASILGFVQVGNKFWLNTATLDVSNATPGTSANTGTATVPNGIVVEALLNGQNSDSKQIYVSALAIPDVAPATSTAPLGSIGGVAGGTPIISGQVFVLTNSSGQFRYRASANTALYFSTVGWNDLTRTP